MRTPRVCVLRRPGVALDPPLDLPPEAVRAALAPLRNDFSVALHSCQNPFAVGAIIRVAHSFLAREIIVIGDSPYYAKASMGMEKYETVVTVADDDAFFAHVRGRPVWALEKDHARRSLYEVSAFPPDVVLVLGSERFGLPQGMVNAADDVIGIPMYGVNHSFPVAVAAGIVMSEWARRRYASGAVVCPQQFPGIVRQEP
jgi:tRNA G18 (ribose-2'-O)-methylase SpoU